MNISRQYQKAPYCYLIENFSVAVPNQSITYEQASTSDPVCVVRYPARTYAKFMPKQKAMYCAILHGLSAAWSGQVAI